MNTFFKHIKSKADNLHKEEGGAVFLLLLAAFLILFMVAMVLFDTGVATGDKVSVQIAADSAAFSQSVVKARTMNAVVYANTIKRMYYSYVATYTSAMAALVAWTIVNYAIAAILTATLYAAGSAPTFTREGVAGTAVIASEAIELAKTTKGTFAEMGREIVALNEYQTYMISVTPWWSYMEGLSRATQNGAAASASWPPPPMEITNDVKTQIADWVGKVDVALGTSLIQKLPSVTTKTDSLPLSQNTSDSKYCDEYQWSFEHFIHGLQTVAQSETLTDTLGPLWKVALTAAVAAITGGCSAANAIFKNDGYLDFRIAKPALKNANTWAQSTSTIALAYLPHAGRNDNKKERKKFGILKGENQNVLEDVAYTNEGYFALSRSEIVYKKAPILDIGNDGNDGFVSKAIGYVTDAGSTDEPDMWSPQWTAKSRPFIMPGENLGDSMNGEIGLDTIVNDTLAILGMTSAIGIATSENASITSTAHDFLYLLRIGSGFKGSKIHGVSK